MMKHYCTYFVLWNFSLYLGLITSGCFGYPEAFVLLHEGEK